MVDLQAIRIGALVWALVGLVVAVPSVATVNSDARLVVGIASVALPACAALSAVAVAKGRLRVAGTLLLLSAATPTYFAFALNVPALIVGIALLVAPGRTVRSSPILTAVQSGTAG